MKKLLIGLIALMSLSSFADLGCEDTSDNLASFVNRDMSSLANALVMKSEPEYHSCKLIAGYSSYVTIYGVTHKKHSFTLFGIKKRKDGIEYDVGGRAKPKRPRQEEIIKEISTSYYDNISSEEIREKKQELNEERLELIDHANKICSELRLMNAIYGLYIND